MSHAARAHYDALYERAALIEAALDRLVDENRDFRAKIDHARNGTYADLFEPDLTYFDESAASSDVAWLDKEVINQLRRILDDFRESTRSVAFR